MKSKTQFSNEMRTAGSNIRNDASAKKLLRYRMILAHILKGCVKEFENISVKDIAEKYIQKEPFEEDREIHGYKIPEKITGQSNEDVSAEEGASYFDLIFSAYLPGEKHLTKFIINIEPQNDFHPGYPLVKRGFYYDARLISAQHGTEFTGKEYGKIKKVISIWICLNPTKKYTDTMTRYHITEENIVGKVKAKKSSYDIMEVIIVGLHDDCTNTNHKNNLINMLSVLFSVKMNADKKEEILENDYELELTREYRKAMSDMCDLREVFRDKLTVILREELREEVKAEVKEEMKEEVKAEVKEEMKEEIKKEYEDKLDEAEKAYKKQIEQLQAELAEARAAKTNI